MDNEIGKIKSTTQGIPAAANATITAPKVAIKQTNVEPPKHIQVSTPKPVDIKYDPAQARANLASAISMLNEQMKATGRGLGFSYDEAKNSPVIKVTDTNSGEVVRQIPSQEVLKMAHHIDALKGILYNKIA